MVGTALVGSGIGTMAPPVTAVVMNEVGTEKAGDGAAVNQVARQVGGALGVAIVGSVFAVVYAAEISENSGAPKVASESIEETMDVADRLGGVARTELLNDAVASFDVAARWGLAVCMAVLLLAVATAAVGLRTSPDA